MLTALAAMEVCASAADPSPTQIARRLNPLMALALAAMSRPPIAVSMPASVATARAFACGALERQPDLAARQLPRRLDHVRQAV